MNGRTGPRFIAKLAAAVLAIAALAPAAAAQEKLKIVATTGMIADAIKQVGGERVAVTALMGPGVDPHTYRQTRSDIAALTKADAVFWHGLYLEAQLEDFLRDLGKRKTVVALAESLPQEQLLSNTDYRAPPSRRPSTAADPSRRADHAGRDNPCSTGAAPGAGFRPARTPSRRTPTGTWRRSTRWPPTRTRPSPACPKARAF
jgi:ABC-type Zn2+ transport system substrate-binding protein/surface adhesin